MASYPIGTIRQWGAGMYRKEGPRRWVPVKGGPGGAVEGTAFDGGPLRGSPGAKRNAAPEQPDQDAAARKAAAEASAAAEYKEKGVRAAAFKQWFGDWEHDSANASQVVDSRTGEPKQTSPSEPSKVVDQAGKPMRLYHAAAAAFSAFDPHRVDEYAHSGPGFYFTEDPTTSGYDKTRSGPTYNCYLNIRKPFNRSFGDLDLEQIQEKLVIGSYERARVDTLLREGKRKLTGLDDVIRVFQYPHFSPGDSAQRRGRRLLEAAGYDGIVDVTGGASYDEDGDDWGGAPTARHWIAFQPTQIKAVDNVGTFDPTNPNMNKGKKANIGEVRNWADGPHRKVKAGEWVEVEGGTPKDKEARRQREREQLGQTSLFGDAPAPAKKEESVSVPAATEPEGKRWAKEIERQWAVEQSAPGGTEAAQRDARLQHRMQAEAHGWNQPWQRNMTLANGNVTYEIKRLKAQAPSLRKEGTVKMIESAIAAYEADETISYVTAANLRSELAAAWESGRRKTAPPDEKEKKAMAEFAAQAERAKRGAAVDGFRDRLAKVSALPHGGHADLVTLRNDLRAAGREGTISHADADKMMDAVTDLLSKRKSLVEGGLEGPHEIPPFVGSSRADGWRRMDDGSGAWYHEWTDLQTVPGHGGAEDRIENYSIHVDTSGSDYVVSLHRSLTPGQSAGPIDLVEHARKKVATQEGVLPAIEEMYRATGETIARRLAQSQPLWSRWRKNRYEADGEDPAFRTMEPTFLQKMHLKEYDAARKLLDGYEEAAAAKKKKQDAAYRRKANKTVQKSQILGKSSIQQAHVGPPLVLMASPENPQVQRWQRPNPGESREAFMQRFRDNRNKTLSHWRSLAAQVPGQRDLETGETISAGRIENARKRVAELEQEIANERKGEAKREAKREAAAAGLQAGLFDAPDAAPRYQGGLFGDDEPAAPSPAQGGLFGDTPARGPESRDKEPAVGVTPGRSRAHDAWNDQVKLAAQPALQAIVKKLTAAHPGLSATVEHVPGGVGPDELQAKVKTPWGTELTVRYRQKGVAGMGALEIKPAADDNRALRAVRDANLPMTIPIAAGTPRSAMEQLTGAGKHLAALGRSLALQAGGSGTPAAKTATEGSLGLF